MVHLAVSILSLEDFIWLVATLRLSLRHLSPSLASKLRVLPCRENISCYRLTDPCTASSPVTKRAREETVMHRLTSLRYSLCYSNWVVCLAMCMMQSCRRHWLFYWVLRRLLPLVLGLPPPLLTPLCQFTPLLILHAVVFGLTSFG